MKITKKYCSEIYDRHVGDLPEIPAGSEDFCVDMIKLVLEKGNKDSRFHVEFDPSNYGHEEEDTWDVIGPGCDYGHVFLDNRDDAEVLRDILNKILRDHFGPKETRFKYTPEAHRAKTILEGSCCPSCGSGDTSMAEHFFKNATCTLYKSCADCGSEWKESYLLHEYQNLKND